MSRVPCHSCCRMNGDAWVRSRKSSVVLSGSHPQLTTMRGVRSPPLQQMLHLAPGIQEPRPLGRAQPFMAVAPTLKGALA
jgi:hypothetical protein